MTTKKLFLSAMAAAAFLSPLSIESAQAGEYCREYTKSIKVGGHRERGYGTACMQPDGSWMIVSARGSVDPFVDLRARGVDIYAQYQPVYFNYGPRFRPVTYVPIRYYHPWHGHWRHPGKHKGWNKNHGDWDDDRWDRDDDDRHDGDRDGRRNRHH